MRYLVRVQPEMTERVQAELRNLGIRPISKVFDYIVVDVPPDMVSKIQAVPGVIEVVRERVYRISAVIPIEKKLQQFIKMISNPLTAGMAFAWSAQIKEKERWLLSESRKVVEAHIAEQEGITGKGVKVAVLDTGWDRFSLQKVNLAYTSSTMEGQPDVMDENGHGDWCITCIGGAELRTPWGLIKGVAPNVTMAAIKCLGYGVGSGSNSSVLRAMAEAVAWGADVISMSLGSDIKPNERHNIESCPLCRIVKGLSDQAIFVIAAGNSGVGYASCPGIAPEAVTVAAINSKGDVAGFVSRRHPQYMALNKPTVSAPGVNTLSSSCGFIDVMEWTDGVKLAAISGTSMATPHAAGVIALWIEYARKKGVNLTTRDIHECIRQGRNWDPDYGYGVIKYTWIKEYLKS